MTVARDQILRRTVGTFTRQYDPLFNGTLVLRMIGAAGKANNLAYHGVVRRAFKFSLSQPGPAATPTGQDPNLPPGLSATPGATVGAPKTYVNKGVPVSNPAPPGQAPAPPPPAPPGTAAAATAANPEAAPGAPPADPATPGVTAGTTPQDSLAAGASGPAVAPGQDGGRVAVAGTFVTALLACIAFGALMA